MSMTEIYPNFLSTPLYIHKCYPCAIGKIKPELTDTSEIGHHVLWWSWLILYNFIY